MKAVIYHNPKCGTSRNTLALIRHAGIEPEVIEYLVDPPSRARLVELINAAGVNVRGAIRKKEKRYLELGLDDVALSDDALLDALMDNPILIDPAGPASSGSCRAGCSGCRRPPSRSGPGRSRCRR